MTPLLDRMFGEPLQVNSDAAAKLARRAHKEDQIEVPVSALGTPTALAMRDATGAESGEERDESRSRNGSFRLQTI